MEATCAKCGITAFDIVEKDSGGYSWTMAPGPAFRDLCSVIIERRKAGKPDLHPDDLHVACPNLAAVIEAKIRASAISSG
jgi:hypothetical protein